LKKKKLKRKIKQMQRDIIGLSRAVRMVSEDIGRHQCHCENYKAKTVTFNRYVPLPKFATTPMKEETT